MSINASVDIKRIEQQLYMHSPSLHRYGDAAKDRIRKKLYNQLQLSQPKVALEKYHVHKLLVNIEKNFQKCKDFGIIQTSNEAYEDFQKRNQLMDLKAVQLSEQSDDDDNDNTKHSENPEKSISFPPDETPRIDLDDNLPLAIRKESRKRIRKRTSEEYETSYSQSSYASSQKRPYTIHSNVSSHHVNINKNDSVDTQVTLTISLPSILGESADNNLEISVDFGKLDLARQVLDQRIRRISDNETNSSSPKTNCAEVNNQNSQQSQAEKEVEVDDEALSCLISEVLVEPNSVETWQATAALENINNNIGDNYNSNIASSQPQEHGFKIKPRKRTIKAKNTPILPKGPPKKRGRKPGQKYEKKIDDGKSDLAKYVELFSNNCELPCTTTSTTLASNMSQMVTSTTQNYEDPQRTANETQTAQISYLINGEWTNGGICQLISPGNVGNIGLDTGHITQEDFSLNTPFEDFVNYIDSSNNDVDNNEIARVLDGNNIAPSTCSNIVDVTNVISFNQSSQVDSLRKMPYSACFADMQKSKQIIPPPAHTFEGGILDLSFKSELLSSVIIEEEKEASTNNCEPIDLSMKNKNDENQLKGSLQLIQGEEESDDLFLRRLIDNSDFDYKDDNSNHNCDSTERNDLLFEPILDANVSFKAALDMPLLDNDESPLSVKQNLTEYDKHKCLDDFTENFGDNNDIIKSAQSKIGDLSTPPRLTFIQIQDSAHLFPALEGNNQILSQDDFENLELTDIVPLQDEDNKKDENEIIDDPGTPPIMSLISKSEDFSNNTHTKCNEEVFKNTTNVVNSNPNDGENILDANKNANDAENLMKHSHVQSVESNIVSNADNKIPDMNNTRADNDADHLIKPHQLQSVEIIIDTKSDIDTVQTGGTMEIDVTETNDTQMTNIEEAFKDDSLNEELASKINVSEASNDITPLEKLENKKSDVNNIVEYHDKDFVDIQTETEVGKDNDQAVNTDLTTRNKSIDNVFVQNVVQVNAIDCNDVDCKAEECIKLETKNDKLSEVHPKFASAENETMQSNVQASADTHSEKTFVENVRENIEVEFNKQRLLEAQPENVKGINMSKSNDMDIINDSIQESSHNNASNNTVESNNSCLLEVVLERNVAKAPIEGNTKKGNENRICKYSDNVQFAETQVESCNLSPSGEIVTEIEDVKPSLRNENAKNKMLKKNESCEFKKQKPPSKLQIISVVSIDSFSHTNEDDNEFIRRTLKNHSNIQNIPELNIKNFQISKNEYDNETKVRITEKSEDCVKINESITEENSDIKEEEVVKSIEEFNQNNYYDGVAVVPEEVKNLFDQDIDIKSETIEVIDINKTLKNSKTKQSETTAFNISLGNTELKKETNDDTEQPNITLDIPKEEKSIIDLSVSSKNNEIFLTEKPTEDFKSLDLTIETKVFIPIDEITDLCSQNRNLEEDNCDKKTNNSDITQKHNPEIDHHDELKFSTIIENKSIPMLVSEVSSPITSNTESNGSTKEYKENISNDDDQQDEQQELTDEENDTKIEKNTLESVISVRQRTEKNNIMTTVSKDALSHNLKNSLFLSNLSLLEMEENFNEPLVFDNHLEDDVLSLATSCFNSPDDDRFDSSKVLDEPDDTDIKPIFVNPEFVEIAVRPQMKEEKDEIEEKEFPIDPISTLTKFKIPKLGAAQINQFMQQSNESQPTKRIELDKIAKTVQNVCAVPPLPLQPPAMCSVSNKSILAQRKHDLFPNTSGNGISCVIPLGQKVSCESFAKDVFVHNNPNYMNMSRGQFAGRGGEAQNSGAAVLDIAKIFGPTCLPFLVDKCSVLGNTQHNHQLRDPGFVQMALEGLPKTELNTAYKFMFNHSKLFKRYFYVFCSVYSKHNNRSKLLNMVYDCEKHTGCVLLLRNIFYSLIECGLNKINACRQILSRSRDKSSATIDVLVGIIFEADWGMFCDYLERFTQMHYSFRINVLSEMAARVLRTKDTRLSSVVCKCLFTLNQDDYKLVNRTPNLIALLELMKDGKVC